MESYSRRPIRLFYSLKKESYPPRGMIVSFADMTQQPTRGLQYAPGRIPLVVQPQET